MGGKVGVGWDCGLSKVCGWGNADGAIMGFDGGGGSVTYHCDIDVIFDASWDVVLPESQLSP